jgi:hypothetical protein
MDIPVVLFHKSEQAYVSLSLRAASQHNADVTLITDTDTKSYGDHVRVVLIENYRPEGAKQFSKIYRHLSGNPYMFEYTAIEKYFYLLEHMKINRLEKIIYIDSDVILYTNLTPIIVQYFNDFDLCSCMPEQQYESFFWSASGHLSYWTINALENFCEFILQTYRNNFEVFAPKWNWHLQNNIPGGINDMTLIYLFQRTQNIRSGSFLQIFENCFSFDNSMKSSTNEQQNEYKMTYSVLLGSLIKKVAFKNKYPYIYNQKLKKEILFYSLHFQADSKKIMAFYMRGKKNRKEYFSAIFQKLQAVYFRIRTGFIPR